MSSVLVILTVTILAMNTLSTLGAGGLLHLY